MKNRINSILGVLLTVILFTACQDFFEAKPSNFISSEKDLFSTTEGATRALNGVYYSLNHSSLYGRNMINELDLFSNDLVVNNSSTPSGLGCWDYTPSDITLTNIWRYLYEGIDRANSFIDNIEQSASLPESTRKTMKAQAQFIRALLYYNLVQNWGDIPLKLTTTLSPQDSHTPLSPYVEVFKAIHNDLDSCIKYLPERSAYPSSEQSSRPAITTAIALKARTYLRQAGEPFNITPTESYTKAAEEADKLITGLYAGKHKLNPSFCQVFINLIQDKYDNVYNENLMEVEFFYNEARTNSCQLGNYGIGFKNKTGGSDVVMGGLSVRTTRKLLDLFPVRDSMVSAGLVKNHYAMPIDARRDWSIYNYTLAGGVYGGARNPVPLVADPKNPDTSSDKYLAANSAPNNNPTGRYFGKFRRDYESEASILLGSPCNFPLIRYAEVLLIFAEADVRAQGNVSQKALDALNEVRKRAYYSYEAADRKKNFDTEFKFIDTNPEKFLKEIQDERVRELVGEGHRRHDLIRWGILQQTMNDAAQSGDPCTPTWLQKVDDPKYRLLPYPENETARNNAMKGKQNQGW